MIIHFSCGATSAIAGAIALKEDPEAELIYADPMGEHPDNVRFLKDCEEKLFHKKVTVLKHPDYTSIEDYFIKKNVLRFVHGAPCTTDLKKKVQQDYLGIRNLEETHVFGYDTGEMPRVERFKNNNPELKLWLPLIEHNLSKPNCMALLQKFGIDLPEMYKLGYDHSNCIGCVKAQNLSYWAAIREDFPDVFDFFAKQERKVGKKDENGIPRGASINRRSYKGVKRELFLDQFPDDIKPKRDLEISCGYSCGNVGDLLEGRTPSKREKRIEVNTVFDWMTK
tara:strand:- start:51 stop:893 length:843 start_codon:yes stop_codon:yes gene_type:complete